MPDSSSNHISNTAHEFQAALFRQGNESALAFFYREFLPALTLFAFRWVKNHQLAQEIASEAFVKTWRMHHKLDSYAGIRAYLYTTVRRDCQHALRQERSRAEFHRILTAETDSLDTPFHHLLQAETYRLVHSALKDLAPGYRKVITMHFIEGKTTGQIARELNAPVNTIKAQKLKGLKALRKKFMNALFLFAYLVVNISSLLR